MNNKSKNNNAYGVQVNISLNTAKYCLYLNYSK